MEDRDQARLRHHAEQFAEQKQTLNKEQFIDTIFQFLCQMKGLDPNDVRYGKKTNQNVEVRQLTWKIVKDYCPVHFQPITLGTMGDFFNKNHATALVGIRKRQDLIDTNKKYRKFYNTLIEILIQKQII